MNTAMHEKCSSPLGKVIPAQLVQMVDPNPPASSPVSAEPRITLIKDGDRVKTIEIQCACGELIRLDCEY